MEPMDARNVWVRRVGGARRQVAAPVAIALAIAVLATAFAIGAGLSEFHIGPGSTIASTALDRGLRYAAVLGPLVLWATLAARVWENRAQVAAVASGAEAALAGLIVALFTFAAVLLIALVGGNLVLEKALALPGATTLEGVLAGALLLLFQSSAEEWFFRGWLQPILATRLGVWQGLFAASILFAAAHAVLNVQSIMACVNVFLAGLLFGLLALRFGNLWAPIAAHWTWNWVEQSVVGLTPNPGVDPLGSLFDLKLTGSPLAGAGLDELNGAGAVTVVFIIVVAALALFPAKGATSSLHAHRRSDRAP
jgi:membrane protease YdiL (CAAX protease family)